MKNNRLKTQGEKDTPGSKVWNGRMMKGTLKKAI